MKKFGSVALIGAPNAGKSTLLNTMLREKLSIVCHKAQTTRFRVAGIYTKEDTQLVLLDTPGIFSAPKSKLDKMMIDGAWHAVFTADLIVLLIDASRPSFKQEVDLVIKRLKETNRKCVVALNKVDLVRDKTKLLAHAQTLFDQNIFQDIFMISGKTGGGIAKLEQFLFEKTPEGEWQYDQDQLSDLPQKIIASELTREVLMHHLHQEIPYGLSVETDVWETFKNKSIKIIQTILVERESHKPILLGKRGEKIKRIGEEARKSISSFLQTPVHLFLHVRISPAWKEKIELSPLSSDGSSQFFR